MRSAWLTIAYRSRWAPNSSGTSLQGLKLSLTHDCSEPHAKSIGLDCRITRRPTPALTEEGLRLNSQVIPLGPANPPIAAVVAVFGSHQFNSEIFRIRLGYRVQATRISRSTSHFYNSYSIFALRSRVRPLSKGALPLMTGLSRLDAG